MLQKLHQLRPFPRTVRKMLRYHWYVVDSFYYNPYSSRQTTTPTQPLPPPTWLSPNRTQPQGRSAANRRVLCASQTSGSARGLATTYCRASHCYRDVSIQRHHLAACGPDQHTTRCHCVRCIVLCATQGMPLCHSISSTDPSSSIALAK